MKMVEMLAVALLLVWCGQALWAAEEGPTSAPVSEPGLKGRSDIVFFEDFEAPDWKTHWNLELSQDAQVTDDARFVYQGRRAFAVRSTASKHFTTGKLYLFYPDGFDRLHLRCYIYLPETFVWGQGRYCHLKLFSLGGRRTGDPWGSTGAGQRPMGTDKFSCTIAAKPKDGTLEFYYYHPDQRGGYGDHQVCSEGLQRGRWQCVETMLKVNAVGQHDGEVACWLDGREVGRVRGVRFRDIEDLRLRRVSITNYWGGAGDENTAAADQMHYIDNVVVATDYIGPAQGHDEGSKGE